MKLKVLITKMKEIPFFILFTAALCSTSAALALLTYRFPDQMGYAANMVCEKFLFFLSTLWE